mmetsp:Transcript_22489/g.66002  ORF Transcript_22489/g.66002 Transcript_22489/m.66002 type:complete len:270 (-) Transcript_22489:365-1174(-)
MRHDDRLVRRVVIRHRRVEAELAALLVVDGADLEAVLCSLDDARVALAVARRARGHAADLRKDARAAVAAAGESDRVLVVVRQVEVAREPRLDRRVVAHDLDEVLGRLRVIVVEPAAAVDDVVLLQHPQPGAHRRRVRKDEELPALLRRLGGDKVLEPGELLVVDRHLVRRVLCAAEDGRRETDEDRLIGNLAHKLRRRLAVDAAEGLEVLCIGGKLVDALEVVVSAHDLVRHAKGGEVLGRMIVARRRPGIQLGRALPARLGLAQVAQ